MKILLALLASTSLAASALAEQSKESAPAPGVAKAVKATITATVEKVDVKKREITLKGPRGRTETYAVDESVKRLDEVKAGDTIALEYFAAVSLELRKPTKDESEHPIEVVEGMGKAPKGVHPAAGGLRKIKVVATVEKVDLEKHLVTLKGPLGNYVEVEAQDPGNLKHVKVGDTVVATYLEAVAISVEKPAAKKG